MRWGLPVLVLMLAVSLGMAGPEVGRNSHSHAEVTRGMVRALGNAGLLGSAVAAPLESAALGASMACANAAPVAAPAGNQALIWAAGLRGWAEGPTVQAWRRFVAWTKGRTEASQVAALPCRMAASN